MKSGNGGRFMRIIEQSLHIGVNADLILHESGV
jgi:hypothetical protein